MRLIPLMIVALFAGGAVMSGCDEEKKEIIHVDNDPEKTPTMKTTDVATLISDSGITRYKITTPLWLMFEEAREPKWTFPNGIHLEKFDLKLKPEATVDCDSAIFFKDKQLWQLDGYVNIHNTLGEKFLTSRLFWDQRQQKIYSDSFIHIERDGKIIEGYGFESNEQMTRYHVLRVAGIFPAKNFTEGGARRDTTANHSAPGTPGAPLPPPPGAPSSVPHAVVSGQADESRIRGRRNFSDPLPDKSVNPAILKDNRLKNSAPKPQNNNGPQQKPSKPGKSPLSR